MYAERHIDRVTREGNMQGKIIKGIAGFYYVYVEEYGVYECKAKGVFRSRNIKPLVGDNVEIDIVDKEKLLGNIVDILPRSSELIRPAVANIDQALLVFALSEPAPKLGLLDRFLVMMESYGLHTVICFNKADEVDTAVAERLACVYADSGCEVVVTSTITGEGMERLGRLLAGKTTALAGPSGVGKSSILNALIPEAAMATGSISGKIGRGRHTTRHSEVFVVEDGTYILDTPGFTSLSVMVPKKEELRFFFPEFGPWEGKCRFHGCVHVDEPGCAVKEAVGQGKIHSSRYESYAEMYRELKSARRK